jgi:mono/diheme cytochrome c family protein
MVAAAPAWAADIGQGEQIARRWCAACHVVSADQKQASTDVPTFSDIAKRRKGEDLKVFLIDPHPKMPDMSLTREEITDLVGYIESRKP